MQMQEIIEFAQSHPLFVVVFVIWTFAWKGVALWKASRLSHRSWFVVFLIVNSIGVLEIIYIFFIARKYTVTEETTTTE